MSVRTALTASATLVASLVSGVGHAALQGRDLDGNRTTFEAYYDTALNVTWLADANYAKTSGYDTDGLMDWSQATNWVANLSFTDGVSVYDNWRLPHVAPINGISFDYDFRIDGGSDVGYYITSLQNEISYMYYVNLGNPAYFNYQVFDPEIGVVNGVASGCYVDNSNTCLDNVGPFSNLQGHFYWNATGEFSQYPAGYEGDGVFVTKYGNQWLGPAPFYSSFGGGNAWAVSSGDVGIAVVPEADTWAMLLAGLMLVGGVSHRRCG